MRYLITGLTVAILALTIGLAQADERKKSFENDLGIMVKLPSEDAVSKAEGLAAFDRIFEVVSHPRCANCHTDDSNLPMWSGPSYGKTRPHGMNIDAGVSRIGVETIPCSTCHRTDGDFTSENNAPPHFGIGWQLAPVEFLWFGQTPGFICEQLKDGKRNGGRDWKGLVHHLLDDAGHRGPVLWGWDPGGDRESAPYSLQEHVDDMIAWGSAGQPCPPGPKELTDYLSQLTNDNSSGNEK